MAYERVNWLNKGEAGAKAINKTNLNQMDKGIYDLQNVELIAVTDITPTECAKGEKYFNTIDNLIYTATDTNTWGTTGEKALQGIFYVVIKDSKNYYYDGTTLISVGGGSGGSNINVVNEKTTSDKDTYSCDYINGTTLYENASGSNETITLSDSAENYSKLIIEYKSSNGVYSSVEISNPNSKRVKLMGDCENMATHIVLISAIIIINGTSLTWNKHSFAVISTNVEVNTDVSYYNLKITKVIGYK